MEIKSLSDRELDLLVAEHLFGFRWWRSQTSGKRALFPEGRQPTWFTAQADKSEELCRDYGVLVPQYSSQLAAAWMVVDRLSEKWSISLNRNRGTINAGFWECFLENEKERRIVVESVTAARAIAEAALMAVERERE